MNRRSAIKKFLVFSAGVAVIPSCLREQGKASIPLQNIKISAGQEELLAEVGETIIPTTDTPGSKDVSAHIFALIMVDDCFKKEQQDKFIKGLNEFEDHSKKKFGNSFAKCSQSQKEQLLSEMESKKRTAQDDVAASFYFTMKKLTLQGYQTSKYYLTKIDVYELVPGPYHGCVPVNKR
jgi:hypothetical protein